MEQALPPFETFCTHDGVLQISWEPFHDGDSAAITVALRVLDQDLAAPFWAGELDNDLLRYPVDAGHGQATLHVPANRPVQLALIVRGAAGELLTARRVHASTHEEMPPHALETPVEHAGNGGLETPLIFAHDVQPPGFRALTQRVALQANTGPAADEPTEVSSGFGARQRWTLTRLQWTTSDTGPLALVVRDRFIDGPTIAAWTAQPPRDAMHLDGAHDGLIDAVPEQDELRFYTLLRGPAPWAPVALSPVPPPFDTVKRPYILGDMRTRLRQGITTVVDRLDTAPLALSDLEPQLLVLRGAVSHLPTDDPLCTLIADVEERWRAGRRT